MQDGPILGQGNGGLVRVAIHKTLGIPFAVKVSTKIQPLSCLLPKSIVIKGLFDQIDYDHSLSVTTLFKFDRKVYD